MMNDTQAKTADSSFYSDRLFHILVLFFGFLLINSILSLFKQATYYEANQVEYEIWLRTAIEDIPFTEIYGKDLKMVCVYPNNESHLTTVLKWDSVEISGVSRGSIEHTEQEELGGLYRVVLVDTAGLAEVWKFDERRFKVILYEEERAGTEPAYISIQSSCSTAVSIIYNVRKLTDGRYELSITAGEPAEGDR
jgi:hypothetical protein